MKHEDISEAMNMLDDELLIHAAGIRNGGKKYMTKRNIAVIAAAAAFLVIGGATAYAGVTGGWMQDIKNEFGAIIGQKYNDADSEIELSVISADETGAAVRAEIKNPEVPPYTAIDMLKIGDYQILDDNGNIVAEGIDTEYAELSDGQAVIYITADLAGAGNLRLVADGLVGYAKADQPLEIEGTWECTFTVE